MASRGERLRCARRLLTIPETDATRYYRRGMADTRQDLAMVTVKMPAFMVEALAEQMKATGLGRSDLIRRAVSQSYGCDPWTPNPTD